MKTNKDGAKVVKMGESDSIRPTTSKLLIEIKVSSLRREEAAELWTWS